MEYIYNNFINVGYTDKDKTHIIYGDYSMVIIRLLGVKSDESSVNIDFSECEKVLKENNPSSEYRMLQINIDNNKENILVDQVEYKVYDDQNAEVDLSVCENVEIPVEYKIKDTSQINLNEVLKFKNMGVDVFNINDKFYNDICFPYSDDNKSSDMILSDRVKDIYQNVSLCGDNCEYKSFNYETQSSLCNCKIKKEIKTEPEKGNFKSYILSSFLDSNFGVIKCYNLLFSSKNKLSNIGFWVFCIMMIVHIPTYIFYFKNGAKNMINFISKEMNDKGYVIPNEIEENNNEKTKNETGKDNNKLTTNNNPLKNAKINKESY